MFSRKVFNVLMSGLMILSLLLGGTTQAAAQGENPPPPDGNGGKITQAERQAAADRAAAKGFQLPKWGEAQMAGETTDQTRTEGSPETSLRMIAPKADGFTGSMLASAMAMDTMAMDMMAPSGSAPHYFSAPNYANSPLRLPDALIMFEGDGSGATASATVDPVTGTLTELMLDNGGSGYSAAPNVIVSSAVATTGTGAEVTATISGSVSGVTLNGGGTGYVAPVTVEFVGGGGSGATATANLATVGFVSGASVTNGGSGYSTAAVEVTGDGTGAAATASLAGPVTDLTLVSGGSNYAAPAVTINGDGTGAAATATVTPVGFITAINVLEGGSGYSSDAMVMIDGDGTGAMGHVMIDPATGAITSVMLMGAGSGYTHATAMIMASTGSGAMLEVVLDTTHGPITGLTLTSGGSGYTAATVSISDASGTGADASAAVTLDTVSAITITNGGSGYTTAAINITGDGNGATADAIVDTASGSITGLTLVDGGTGYTSAPDVVITGSGASGSGASATAAISGSVTSLTLVNGGSGYVTPGIRKFVDGLPGLTAAGANNLGQYIPVAQADTTTYPGSDYYEIAVVEYKEQMHSDLPPTTLRGYVQLSTSLVPGDQFPLTYLDGTPILLPDGSPALAVEPPHYLGPLISAAKDKPVRILFRNLLPTGLGGDLFIPVDTTVMGSGMGPAMANEHGQMHEPDPLNPMCGMTPKPAGCYTENRATLHLHGGLTPWISDGTPHQWITPAGESTTYPAGVSVENVPDMPDPGPGAMTFFYTNQQSARLMFYHDHSWGITRLNVYAGEAAAYLISDPKEQELIDQQIIPAEQIPLVIQDKTFVPPTPQLAMQDPNWDLSRWDGFGGLWLPHVYSPAQNPGDSSGVNQFGRWAYGPWFWPPTNNIDYPPVANPYYDPMCDPDVQWCEPPLMPGVPYVSMGMEAFNDTPLVNGTLYPTVSLQPKSYRFRVLNAANDRFFNLSIYKAVDANGAPCDPANVSPAPSASGEVCTEVLLNPDEVAAALDDQTIFPTPLAGTEGPDWIQIGTEGGFLPAPAVIPAQPTTWVNDPTVFNAGNVDQHSLLLGPAERADVIVDFSAFAGQTLILYNDAPAAFPARDPRYDYYTGNADLTETGGAPSTLSGFGPNTRTVMQIKIADAAPAAAFNLAALEAAFAHQADGSGVFEASQNPIIVGQGAYNSAYGTSFQNNGPNAGLVQIFDSSITFKTLAGGASGPSLTIPFHTKMIQDEMGEAFEKEYGRMSGYLGLEVPANGPFQNMILYPYVNPASEILDGIELPPGVELSPITSTDDGTQIWKITHNGVDTHPIHFHLYDVQLINRVGWDGIIRKPDANELGWKDTVRISPLEDTIVAFRPVVPKAPFGVPDSIRPLNPMMPIGSTAMFNSIDALGEPITPPISNQIVNFGWEYVWHCHILSHEEMDMMRPVKVNVARALPTAPVLSLTGESGASVDLSWTDGTPVTTDPATWGDPAAEIGYRIERATGGGAFEAIGLALANQTSFTDNGTAAGASYQYRVVAFNAAGDSPSNPLTLGTVSNAYADFTGDGKTDIGVFRPSNGLWSIKGLANMGWGQNNDIPVPGNYNGNANWEIGIFRPSDNSWRIQGQALKTWGQAGDIPVPGDYNGDGVFEIGVFRPSDNSWRIQGQPLTLWGQAGDIPVPGNYVGDSAWEVAVFRPSDGGWRIKGQPLTIWGQNGDIPVPGDYSGDGLLDIAVFRPSDNGWRIKGQPLVIWGQSGDVPVPGDYLGGSAWEIGVFRPSDNGWRIQGQPLTIWGQNGDIPLTRQP